MLKANDSFNADASFIVLLTIFDLIRLTLIDLFKAHLHDLNDWIFALSDYVGVRDLLSIPFNFNFTKCSPEFNSQISSVSKRWIDKINCELTYSLDIVQHVVIVYLRHFTKGLH